MNNQELPYLLNIERLDNFASEKAAEYSTNKPFKHVVIDGFLETAHVDVLDKNFPEVSHEIWLDWKVRSPHQFLLAFRKIANGQ